MYSSPQYTLYNPYRPSRKGYIVHKKRDSPSYRSLTMMELKQLKKHYNLGPPQNQLPSQTLRDNIYKYFMYQHDPFDDMSAFRTVAFDTLTPIPHPNGQTASKTIGVGKVVSGQASYRYVHYMIVSSQGFTSFYCFILHRVTTSLSSVNFQVTFLGLRPEDRLYFLATSDSIARASGDSFSEQNYPSMRLLDTHHNTLFVSGYQTIFHVFPDGGVSPTLINIAFTGDSPKYPYALLPTRLFIGLNAPTPASAAE
ncbi:MAG: hypothetical protein [Irmovirus amras]|uniref:Uncharacterized protein n=1 Tax=Circoviridae sp. TaxID=1954248 RepID=A0A345MVN4_9VIRU|nr:MAG: hypothetical protein [Circoviridae sp.]